MLSPHTDSRQVSTGPWEQYQPPGTLQAHTVSSGPHGPEKPSSLASHDARCLSDAWTLLHGYLAEIEGFSSHVYQQNVSPIIIDYLISLFAFCLGLLDNNSSLLWSITVE